MAKCGLFFLLLLISTFLHIEARESKFFNKATRNQNHHNEISASPQLAPAPSPLISLTSTTHGLFSHASEYKFSPATTTTASSPTNNSDEFDEEEPGENYEEEETNYATATTNNNNNGYSNNYYSANNNNNNNNNNGFGLSDTRFLENGKYYYDGKSTENYNNGYEAVRGNGNNEGYYGDSNRYYEAMEGSKSSDQGYYGKSENPNEFDTMEEYERQQGYSETQEDQYVP